MTSFPGINDLPGSTGAAARTACEAVGGFIANKIQGNSVQRTSANQACAFPQAPFQNLVNENDQVRAYLEYNGDISESMEFHFDVNYSKSKTLQQQVPIGPASATAIDRTFSALCSSSCNYVIPTQNQTFNTLYF